MGIHGLATFLRENQRALSKPLKLPTAVPIALVVDGWSFIYELYNQSGLPWVYGGEYTRFSDLVVRTVEAWLNVGVRPFFVFDGPYPPLKFATAISRASENIIQPSLLFFRTSEASRSTPRFLRENSIIPPLCYTVCVHALKTLSHKGVEVHFADVEGDPYAVELAGRVRGYVTGHDSDFVVLNTDGYQGYIPMDEMIWTALRDSSETSVEPEDDGGFTVTRKPKRNKKSSGTYHSGQGLIPPDFGTDLSLACSVYRPSDLAAHLHLPMTLLPLLGALVGNDYTADQRRSTHRIFFEHSLTVSQRITRVANTLQSIIAAVSGTTQKRRLKRPINSVVDLIGLTVDALLLGPSSSIGAGEREAIVEKTVEAALQYSIPKHDGDPALWQSDVCALHDPDRCPFVLYLSPQKADKIEENPSRAHIRSRYTSAYRRGTLSPRLMDLFSTGTLWPRLFLEDPDLEPTARSIGRPLREWTYAILNDGIGLPEQIAEDQEESSEDGKDEGSEDDSDELIDVVEEDSDSDGGDPLAPLRGALQQLGGNSDTDPLPTTPFHLLVSSQPRSITEYIRRGTKLGMETVPVPSIAALAPFLSPDYDFSSHSPIQSRSEDERLALFLRLLHSESPAFKALPPMQLMAVLALRWVVRRLHERAESHGFGKERDRERWTQREAMAYLAAFAWSSSSDTAPEDSSEHAEPLVILNRSIQLMAQVSVALDAIEMLSQTLLLHNRVSSPAPLFSGHIFHRKLADGNTAEHLHQESEYLRVACSTGLENMFGAEKGKRGKKERRANRSGQPELARREYSAVPSQGLFSVLASMDS